MAEIAVRDLRTTGFWIYEDDFFTAQIKPIFHRMEIKAQTAPRETIPNASEVSLDINAGMNATA